MRTYTESLAKACMPLVALVMLLTCGLAGAADVGPELLPNGDMEQDAHWTSNYSGGRSLPRLNEQSRADKHGGAASRHLVLARERMSDYPGVISGRYAAQAGKTYEVRFWYKVLKGSFGVLSRNGADKDQLMLQPNVNFGPRNDVADKDLVWREYIGTYTERAGGDKAYLRFYIASAGEAEFYLDDVSVREIDTSAAAALRRWHSLGLNLNPARPYVCWRKSPWDNLDQVQLPRADIQDCSALTANMGQKEYESASFVLTNLSDQELAVTVSLRPSRLAVTLRQAMWVTEHDGARANDALPLLEGPLNIPSGESREVWLTIQTRGEQVGVYQTAVEVKVPGVPTTTVPLRVEVYPVALPEDKPLHTHYWDYMVPQWHGWELTRAYVADLKRHYVNVGVMHPWPARMRFDEAGQLKKDYTDLDPVLEAYRLLDPRILLIDLTSENYLEKQDGFFSEAWKLRFKSWLTDLVKHLADKGFGYDRIVLYPYDESIRPAVAAMARLIKETDPKLRVYVNTVGQTEQQVRDVAPYVDLWDPYLYDYLGYAPFDRPAALRKLASALLRKDDRLFWTYANPLGTQPKLAPPYRDYRLVPWRAWTLGMSGTGYWIYSYKTHWNSYKHEDGLNWAVVYLANAKDAPPGLSQKELVIPGKRWEATREGVEDYCYLYMLRQAIGAAEQRGVSMVTLEESRKVLTDLPAVVLNDENNAALADQAKTQAMAAIARLSALPQMQGWGVHD